MKKLTNLILCVAAIGAIASATWVMASSPGEVLPAKTTLASDGSAKRASVKKLRAASGDETSQYWTMATSYYRDGSYDPKNGDGRQFGTRIEIDGSDVTIHGLVYYYYGDVKKEFPVCGKYDYRTGNITIPCKQYKASTHLDEYVKLAEVTTSETPYTLVLFSGSLTSDGIATADNLVIKMSEDMKTAKAQSGFGAYAFNEDGNPVACYDFYQSGTTYTLATPDGELTTSVESINFNDNMVFANVDAKEVFYLYNMGSESSSFTITTSSPEITVDIKEGSIGGCESLPIELTLNAPNPGLFEGSVTISSDKLAEPVIMPVKVELLEFPDYAKITCEGSVPMTYDMSPQYPFIITEYDGHLAAMSTNNGKGDGTQSFFVCSVDVPEGKVGVFSWDAVHIAKEPNSLYVILDGAKYIKYDSHREVAGAYDMSGITAIPEGHHEISFMNWVMLDWTDYGIDQIGYVWNLDMQLLDSKPAMAVLENQTADFGSVYVDKLSTRVECPVKLLNLGTEKLKVTGITSDGGFSGILPSSQATSNQELEVVLTWDASELGKAAGTVTIRTNAGDFTVDCSGTAEKLPYDYTGLVTEGDISFNTDMSWPFVMSENGKYAYNSSSKAEIPGPVNSWLEASFEVPEGKVGQLSWDAINSSEDLFVFMDIPSIISGTYITIDGQNEVMLGGIDAEGSSSALYSPDLLMLKPGRHSVKFNYRKTSDEEEYIHGNDSFRLFGIALKCVDNEDYKGELSKNLLEFTNVEYVGCVGHMPLSLFNYSEQTPELLSYSCDGPFKVKSVGVTGGNLDMVVEFSPEEGGTYESVVEISTNIGDYSLRCKGAAEESSIGKPVYYESFEYVFADGWIFDDFNGDGNGWQAVADNLDYLAMGRLGAWDGDGLLVTGYDPDNGETFNVDDYALTPEILIPDDGSTTLRFMAQAFTNDGTTLKVLAGTGDNVSQFKMVEEIKFDSKTPWAPVTVSLDDFRGEKIRIALHGAKADYFLTIDDFLVASTGTINSVSSIADDLKASVEYYTISGLRSLRPVKGVNIKVTRYGDGTVKTRKIFVE